MNVIVRRFSYDLVLVDRRPHVASERWDALWNGRENGGPVRGVHQSLDFSLAGKFWQLRFEIQPWVEDKSLMVLYFRSLHLNGFQEMLY